MKLARLKGKTTLHTTIDGIHTGCGVLIPETATLTRSTDEWYLHTNCYNCTYRLWSEHGPDDYICPHNGKDFPPRRKCEHGRIPAGCAICTPPKPTNWPCPNGCTDEADHIPGGRSGYVWATACTIFPPSRPLTDQGECAGECESYSEAMHRANPKLRLDMSDSTEATCYHCGRDTRFPMDRW